MHEECHKAEDWILDLGTNAGRLSLYEQTVAFYLGYEKIDVSIDVGEEGVGRWQGEAREMADGDEGGVQDVEHKDGFYSTGSQLEGPWDSASSRCSTYYNGWHPPWSHSMHSLYFVVGFYVLGMSSLPRPMVLAC